MKRLLTFILALALLLNASGQILRYSNYTLGEPPAPPPDFYDEYDTVYAAFTTKPNSTIADYQEALVYSLDTLDFAGGASVWDRCDLFYVFAAHTNGDGEALINWVDPGSFDADDPTTVQWDNLQGYTGAATKYISTNWDRGDSVHFGQNTASIGVYIRNNTTSDDAVLGTSSSFRFIARNSGDVTTAVINSAANQTAIDQTDSRGLWIATRRSPTDIEIYRNGSSIDTETDASAAVATDELHILKRNGSSNSTTYQVSIFFVMNGITDAEATAINTVIETYMDAIGYGVE